MVSCCAPQYAKYNVAKLCNTGQPIATIKAVHTGPNASKVSSEDASAWT